MRKGLKIETVQDSKFMTLRCLLKPVSDFFGEDLKIVQVLLRKANITTTMNLYVQGFSEQARNAQSNVIEMVTNTPVMPIPVLEETTKPVMCTNVPRAKGEN